MNEKDAMRIARKFYGISSFEKKCRITSEGNKQKKAYKIPGTREHGDHSMLMEQVQHFYRKLISE